MLAGGDDDAGELRVGQHTESFQTSFIGNLSLCLLGKQPTGVHDAGESEGG